MQQTLSAGAGLPAPRRRPLTRYLLAVIFLQGCLYAGLRASPWFARGWRPQVQSAGSRASQWRRARYDPNRDPIPGMDLPLMELAGAGGGKVPLIGARGERTAILFVGDGST